MPLRFLLLFAAILARVANWRLFVRFFSTPAEQAATSARLRHGIHAPLTEITKIKALSVLGCLIFQGLVNLAWRSGSTG
jgi:hypothetical protein